MSTLPTEHIKPYEIIDAGPGRIPGLLRRYTADGTPTAWYLRYYARPGKQEKLKLASGVVSVADARHAAKKVLGEVANGNNPAQDRRSDKGVYAFGDFVEVLFYPDYARNLKSGDLIVARLRSLFHHLWRWPLNDPRWRREVEKWISNRADLNKQASTIRRDVAALQSVFSRAVEWGAIEVNPLSHIRLPKMDRNQRESDMHILTTDEIDRLIVAAKERDTMRRGGIYYPLISLLIHTGLRRGEALRLRWSNIDFDRRLIAVPGEISKSSSTRIVPMNQTLTEIMISYRDNPSRKWQSVSVVFPNPKNGGQMEEINTAWEWITKRAGLYGIVRLHDLRHSAASRMLARGVDIKTVQDLLGHASIVTTQIYLHTDDQRKAEAVAALDGHS